MHQSQRSCLKEETVKTKLKFPTIQICFNKINRLNYTLSKTGRKKKKSVFINFCVFLQAFISRKLAQLNLLCIFNYPQKFFSKL